MNLTRYCRATRTCQHSPAFTLIEVLIVVMILGILATIVIPQLAGATEDAEIETARHELYKLRRAIEVYEAVNNNTLPNVTEGDGTWGALTSGNQYLKSAPVNPYVGGANAGVIVFGAGPDAEYQSNYGWIYDPATGQVWAGSFDNADQPHPKP